MNVYFVVCLSLSLGCCIGYILSSIVFNSKYPVIVALPAIEDDGSVESFLRKRYEEDLTFSMREAIEEGTIVLIREE